MSDTEFPTYAKSAQFGDKGVRLVNDIVSEQLGWIFIDKSGQKDLGIDAHFEILSDNGKTTGRLIAAQIKCGPSFFRSSDENGFIFYGERRHLNYYVNYSLPVIIIICNPETQECFWCEVDPMETEQTRKGWKIIIPVTQRFNSGAKKTLSELAGPSHDYMPALEKYWGDNELLASKWENIHIIVTRDDIDSKSPERVVTILRRFTTSKKVIRENKLRISISVFGYENDQRELFEISKVRKWFKKLSKRFHYWFYFAPRDDSTLRLIAACLCRCEILPNHVVSINSRDLADFMLENYTGLNDICNRAGYGEQEIFELSASAAKYFYPDIPYETFK